MNRELHERAKAVFLGALQQPATAREAWVQEAVEGDSALLQEVQSLLEFHEDEHERPTADSVELAAGSLYAGRYRIVRRIGRGGMGEVFEARDETLGVTVALKRLRSGGFVQQESFLNEVRLARQVTHPTVCRVFDIGEWHGDHFLTMEFIDGEDLSSLLRRVGRLPTERVAEIGRSLCVGLAAAHTKGVIHRDLKPGNILIDSSGRVHITDFGIAVLRDDTQSLFRGSGTPSYMAPEQLIPGGAVTERADIFALGLVLHEMLTGHPVFPGDSRTEVIEQRRNTRPQNPSDLVSGVDPTLERAISSCLENDPSARPSSVLRLAAALPGGDALGVAVEAGVTPSPELVAEARRAPPARTGSGPLPWFGALIVLLLSVAAGMSIFGYFPAPRDDTHPQVRTHRAAQLLREAGAPQDPLGTFHGYIVDPTSREEAKPLLFWYREDGVPHRSTFQQTVLDPAERLIVFDGIPAEASASNVAIFDAEDNLVYLSLAVSDSGNTPGLSRPQAFEHAGIDPSRLIRLGPPSIPIPADSTWAWSTPATSQPHSVRVEAAERDDRIVYFSAGLPYAEAHPQLEERLERVGFLNTISAPLVLAILIVGTVLAIRNTRHKRVDWKGTCRVFYFCVACFFLSWLLTLDYLPHPGLNHGTLLASRFIFLVVINPLLIFVIYPAIEPGIRRFLPRALVAWSRATRGDVWNADIGWSLLVGTTLGCGWVLLSLLDKTVAQEIAGISTPGIDHSVRLQAAQSLSGTVALMFRQIIDAIGRSGIVLLVFLLFRMGVGRERLAWIGVVVVIGTLQAPISGSFLPLSWLTIGLPVAVSIVWVLQRHGLLALVVAGFVDSSLRYIPVSLHNDVWWARGGMLALVAMLLLGVIGWAMVRTQPRSDHARVVT